MRRRAVLVVPALVAAVAAPVLAQLKPHTLQVWDRFVAVVEARIENEKAGRSPFLSIDRQPDSQRRAAMATLASGGVVVASAGGNEAGASLRDEVRDGMIQHWFGTVLIPRATIDDVVRGLQQYETYDKVFAPTITRPRIVKRTGDRFEVTMRTYVSKMLISVTQDQEWVVDYVRLSPTRTFVRSVAKLYDIGSPGTSSETRTPVDQGAGWLWRLHNYCSFEQRTEGTYEQCESITLTRPIPWLARFIVSPIVQGMARDTLSATLGQVRKAYGK